MDCPLAGGRKFSSWRVRLLAGLLAGVLPTLLGQAASASGIYYVDNTSASCSNSGPGTQAQPYCSIAAAVSARGGPGTTIYVKPGIYREQVSINVSGASGSPMVIQALGGTVTMDGADDFSSTAKWSAYSGNVYLASSVTWSPVQVIIDATRLAPSTVAPASLPANSYTYVAGQGLYVNFGGPNPGTHQVNVGHRAYCFSMYTQSYITIDGFQLLHADDRAVNLGSSCTNITVTHCNASWNWKYGIFSQGGSGFLFGSNTCSDNQDHGIAMISGSSGSTIEDNECARNARLDIREANGIYLFGCPNNVLRRNRTHDNQDTGLHIQSGSDGNLLYLNRSWNNGDHGFDHLLANNNTHIGDVAYGNYKDGFSIEGTATGQHLYDCIAIDNGLTTNEFDLWVDSASTAGFVSDYNIFWNSTSQTPYKYIATQYSTLAAYQAASGQDPHSIQANPKFVNANAGDFHLQAGSPAIDSGNSGVTNWPSLDADGQARVDDPATPNTGTGPIAYSDRGSFEYVNVGVPHPPVVTAPGTATGTENVLLTVNVTASDPDGDPITSLTASGLPSGANFTAGSGNTSGTLTWTPASGQSGSYPVTFTASNALSGSATTVLKIGIPDRAPVVTAPATAPGTENAPLVVNISASDPDGDPISSLTASGLPSGAIFTPGAGNTTGQLTWTPTYTQAGTYMVTFTAANGLSGSSTTALTIANVDRPPSLATGGTVHGTEGVLLTTGVTAADPDGDAIASLTVSGLPAGATFTADPGNTSGTLSWTPDSTQAGTYTVTFTASNALSGSAATTMIIAHSDRAPRVTAPATAAGAENALLTVNVSASDPDGDAIASLSATGLPAGASFTPGPGNTTGQLSWTPGFTQAGTYTVTFTAANALSGSASTAITIANTDQPPAVTAAATVNGSENVLLTMSVTASDPDGDAITSLTASGLPAGATFTAGAGNTSGQLSWTPSFTQAGTYTVTFTASNVLSGSATTTLVIANTDRAPVVTAPVTAAGSENALLTINVSASDADGDAITSLTASGLPAGATFTAGAGNTSGQVSWTPSFTQAGSYTIQFTATNAKTGSASTAVTISNVDRAPQVSAPPSISVRPGFPLIFQVTASDPDGDAISSLSAGLPPGATFTSNGSHTSGTFSWTPASVGNYSVTFTGTNALSGSATTQVTVSLTADQNPVVTAPASLSPRANSKLTFTVTASDPDGNAINSLVGSPLPSGASFSVGSGNTSGTFTWTPTVAQQGSYSVSFTASNVLIGWATTSITVRPPNQLPTAALTMTPATGNEPLAVVADASGSSDPDGGIATYNFNFGDGTVTGQQATSTASHSYAAGTWTCTVTVTDVDGGTASTSKTVIVAPVTPGANLIANPSFETNTSGWAPLDIATLTRVAGGFDGGFALQVSTSKNQTFGVEDNPNSVASAGAAGTRYRCQAWIRSNSATGDVRLRVREYSGASLVASANSTTKQLSTGWQMLTLDYSVRGAGHSLDVSLIDTPHGSNGAWLVDDLSLRVLTGAAAEAPLASGETSPELEDSATPDPLALAPPLHATLAPSPIRTSSTLSFRTTLAGPLRVALYDAQGRRVRMLLDDPGSEAGVHRLPVEARGDQGPLLAGVYFYRIEAVEGASSGRLVIAR